MHLGWTFNAHGREATRYLRLELSGSRCHFPPKRREKNLPMRWKIPLAGGFSGFFCGVVTGAGLDSGPDVLAGAVLGAVVCAAIWAPGCFAWGGVGWGGAPWFEAECVAGNGDGASWAGGFTGGGAA